MNTSTTSTVSTVVFAFAWLVVFFTSFAEFGVGTAAQGATLIAAMYAGIVCLALGNDRRCR